VPREASKPKEPPIDYLVALEEPPLPPLPGRPPLAALLSETNKKPAPLSSFVSKRRTMTRWPQMTTLMGDEFQRDVLRLLQGAYECDAHLEPTAKDGPDVKGNAWIKYHDHAFGGGDQSRGLIRDFPVIKQVTVFKRKIVDIWKYAVANKESVPQDIYDISEKQYSLYKEACDKEKAAKGNEVLALAKLKDDMNGYEYDSNALPPGAKGKDGAGRNQHSTNLALGDPACYAYANQKTPSRMTTPRNSSSSSGAAKGHNQAMVSIDGMENMMSMALKVLHPTPKQLHDEIASAATTETNKKRKRLEDSKNLLMEEIKFQKELGEEYQAQYRDYLSVCAELRSLVNKDDEE
jgi:hypothetical protein